MSKVEKSIDNLFKTLSKDKNITGFSITVGSGTKEEETVEFTKEEINAIAKPKRTQNNRGEKK
jgi:hypothetical protein